MFARFIGLRRKLEAGRKRQTVELTVENSGLTPAQLANAKKAMRVLKLDVSAPQTKDKLVIFLYTVGLNPTEDVIDSKLRSLNLHDAQHITFAHFCHVWFAMLQDLSDEEEILRRAFQFFDKDGNGEISVHELRTTMHELGDLLTEDEIMSFMAIMDIDNDGVIGYQEFLSTLKTQAPDNDEDQEEMDEDRWVLSLQATLSS
ncbi:hypothetical protein DUNSADRAFT_869 [Dunaliella salina]|uniref:EF-hand domain-containing protein n=1 Tax=Dunaliella salina TaxID=3046 RepID=A0ABQ7FYI7_DUNSA|nr:hypothetical protein DUNSADRAFT_869 [Dunaliella salina]|eukprot:KAF5827314.1 hypothetical protein DUNSADRAFT_869 [Dunaliella salina]